MSEFSDSYHLRTSDPTQVTKLLRVVRRYGAVLPTTTPFIPFLVDGRHEAGGVVEDVVTHNPGVLVHYAYAEDHGLWIRIFDKAAPVATIEIHRRRVPGNEVAIPQLTAAALTEIGAISRAKAHRLAQVLQRACDDVDAPLEQLRDDVVTLLGLSNVSWLSCADLTHLSEKEILRRLPDATFVLKGRRGRAEKEQQEVKHEPNEWCPCAGMPACMYLEVPDGAVDEAMLARHLEHWLTTGDWDEASQSGFWMYTAYERALPSRMQFLAHRIMNLRVAYPDTRYGSALERTIRGILVVAPRDFDWDPYLARRRGEQRL